MSGSKASRNTPDPGAFAQQGAPEPSTRTRLRVRCGDRNPARVRPSSLTGGRTRSGHVLLVETFVASSPAALEAPDERLELTNGSLSTKVMPELRAIVELCRRMRTVA